MAEKQFGYITREQLYALELTRRAIEFRIGVGRLIPGYRGVYAVGYVDRTPVPGPPPFWPAA